MYGQIIVEDRGGARRNARRRHPRPLERRRRDDVPSASRRFSSLSPGLSEIANVMIELRSVECLLWVTGGKTPSEYIFSELTQVADIARSAFHHVATPSYRRSLRSGPSHFRLSSGPIISLVPYERTRCRL